MNHLISLGLAGTPTFFAESLSIFEEFEFLSTIDKRFLVDIKQSGNV
jgi:hypothetical protein